MPDPILNTGLMQAMGSGFGLGQNMAQIIDEREYRKEMLREAAARLMFAREQEARVAAQGARALDLNERQENRIAADQTRRNTLEDQQRSAMVALGQQQGLFNPTPTGMGPPKPGDPEPGVGLTPEQFGSLPGQMQAGMLAPTMMQMGDAANAQAVARKRAAIDASVLSPDLKKQAHAYVSWRDEMGLPGNPPRDFDPEEVEMVKQAVGENSPAWRLFKVASKRGGDFAWQIYDRMVESVLDANVRAAGRGPGGIMPDAGTLRGTGKVVMIGQTDAKGKYDEAYVNAYMIANGKPPPSPSSIAWDPTNRPGTMLSRTIGMTSVVDPAEELVRMNKTKMLLAQNGIPFIDPRDASLAPMGAQGAPTTLTGSQGAPMAPAGGQEMQAVHDRAMREWSAQNPGRTFDPGNPEDIRSLEAHMRRITSGAVAPSTSTPAR